MLGFILIVVASLVAGYGWGRLSALLPISELFRLLSTPLWTGGLGVVAGWILLLAQYDPAAPHVLDFVAGGLASMAWGAFRYSLVCFLAGAAFGPVGVCGWCFAYRQSVKDA
jgi:hypothetical protein